MICQHRFHLGQVTLLLNHRLCIFIFHGMVFLLLISVYYPYYLTRALLEFVHYTNFVL